MDYLREMNEGATPSEAVSFLKKLETNKIGAESELICQFPDPEHKASKRSYRKFVKMLSATKKLKHLTISMLSDDCGETLAANSDQLGKALADNDSLETLKISSRLLLIHFFSPEKHTANFINFLTCLERNTSLADISLENLGFENEVVDYILGSSVLRIRLVSLSTLRLKTSKQIHGSFYKFSRLTELGIHVGFGMKTHLALRNLCFCEQLKKLSIQGLEVKKFFLAFPKWTNELNYLFPLKLFWSFESSFTSLLKDVLAANVAEEFRISDESSVNTTDIRSFLAAAERKERKIKIKSTNDAHISDSLLGDTIRFAACLRSKDADWKRTVFRKPLVDYSNPSRSIFSISEIWV